MELVQILPFRRGKNGSPSAGVPFPYVPASLKYPQVAIFLRPSLYRRFFMYLVLMRPARPLASTRYLKLMVPLELLSLDLQEADTGRSGSESPWPSLTPIDSNSTALTLTPSNTFAPLSLACSKRIWSHSERTTFQACPPNARKFVSIT